DGNKVTDELILSLDERLADSFHVLEKTGIVNVCNRIRLKYGEHSGLFVSRSEYGGLKAEIIIQFNYGGGSDA
ncbi:two-component sensor histidine kinase, partial [Paenibacillus sp. TAF58]